MSGQTYSWTCGRCGGSVSVSGPDAHRLRMPPHSCDQVPLSYVTEHDDNGIEAVRAALAAATPGEPSPPAEPLHEVSCPQCGATIRARIADAPDVCGPPLDHGSALARVAGLIAVSMENDGICERGDLDMSIAAAGAANALSARPDLLRALLSGGEQS